MPFALDASIVVCWHFQDEQNAAATAVLDSLARETAIAPVLWWFEVRNALLLGERRGRASQDQTLAFLDKLSQLPITLAETPEGSVVMEFARRHRLSFYDAAYLELAQREKLALATLDDALATAARREGVALVVAS